MAKEEQIPIRFPNFDPQLVPVSVIKEWDIIDTNEIGDTVFCKFEDKLVISMGIEDYNKVFNKK